MKPRHRLIPLILIIAPLASCGSKDQVATPAPPVAARIRNTKIPAEVSYPVIKDYHDKFPANSRRLVDVRLNMKVTEEVLREIALEIKTSVPEQYERTMIAYYLPEEVIGVKNSPWATTDFMPTLDVRILGMTTVDEARLRSLTLTTDGEKIGSWLIDYQSGGHIDVIYEDKGPRLATFYPDGQRNLSPMVEFPAEGGRRFRVKDSTETYEIDKAGVLRLMAADGRVFAGAFPLK